MALLTLQYKDGQYSTAVRHCTVWVILLVIQRGLKASTIVVGHICVLKADQCFVEGQGK